MAFVLQLLFSLFMAQAQSPYLGMNLGLSDATGPLTPKQVAISGGGRVGFIFYDHIGFGAVAHYYTSNEPTENIAYMPLLAEFLYYPTKSPYEPNTFYIGASFGATQMVIKNGTGKHSDNATTFGVSAGYSILLWERYNLGPELQYLFLFTNQDDFKLINAQFSLKILF